MIGKRFIVQLGMGVEIHGQEMTEAAVKAVKDATGRACIGVGLNELYGLTGHDDIALEVLVACPRPEEVDVKEIRKVLLSKRSDIKVVRGGMLARGHLDPYYGDQSDEIIVANAAVTVYIDTDKANPK